MSWTLTFLSNLDFDLNQPQYMTEPSDQSVAKSTAPENEPDLEEAATENQAIPNSLSARRPPGLPDLPPEIRVIIYRHLLVRHHRLDFEWLTPGPLPFVDILRTNRLIHNEAFAVLYGQNEFTSFLGPPYQSLTSFPRVTNAIQNVHVEVPIYSKGWAIRKFLRYMKYLGTPSIARGTLNVQFRLDGPGSNARRLVGWCKPLKWFLTALGRFANFMTIEIHCYRVGIFDQLFNVLDFIEAALEPVLGKSEYLCRTGNGLRFYPLREVDAGDWADSLDGIRLDWNEDATSTDESERPAQTEEEL